MSNACDRVFRNARVGSCAVQGSYCSIWKTEYVDRGACLFLMLTDAGLVLMMRAFFSLVKRKAPEKTWMLWELGGSSVEKAGLQRSPDPGLEAGHRAT